MPVHQPLGFGVPTPLCAVANGLAMSVAAGLSGYSFVVLALLQVWCVRAAVCAAECAHSHVTG